MAPEHHVYLVPGFFGFANLGQITYFGHVRRILAQRLAARGLSAHLHVVRTHPTASLPRRAARLAETMAASAGRGGGPLHIVGHSSGGLDARLLVAPAVALPTRVAVERLAARVRTVVTLATPHHGTPLASFFATLQGQRLLQLLSLATIYVLRFGQLPIAALLRLAGVAARLEELVENSGVMEALFGRLLEDFSVGRRRAVRALLRQVARDQALMLQLTPEAMQLFEAAVLPRAGVRYGSVITQARRPSLRSRLAVGLDPAGQVTRALYGALYPLAAATPRGLAPRLAPELGRALRRAYGRLPSPAANDGIVPTRSQLFGELLHAAVADHLDVLGHFRDAQSTPPHVDWIVTGSGFDRAGFEAVWDDVARFVAGGEATFAKPPRARRERVAQPRGRRALRPPATLRP